MIKMFAIITAEKLSSIPDFESFAYYIWTKDVSYSIVSDGPNFNGSSSVAISLNKRLINQVGKNKIREYIYFDIKTSSENINEIEVSVDENAAFLNERAFYRAVDLILTKTNGKIISFHPFKAKEYSLDKEDSIITTDNFKSLSFELLEMDYNTALERSLQANVDRLP